MLDVKLFVENIAMFVLNMFEYKLRIFKELFTEFALERLACFHNDFSRFNLAVLVFLFDQQVILLRVFQLLRALFQYLVSLFNHILVEDFVFVIFNKSVEFFSGQNLRITKMLNRTLD